MTTATGGKMRCEIIQNAMSSLPSARLKRRPTVWSSSRKSASASASASCQARPTPTTSTIASATASTNRPMLPSRGR